MAKAGKLYDVDWKSDKREGYGVLSRKVAADTYVKEYAGSWKANKRHVCVSKPKEQKRRRRRN